MWPCRTTPPLSTEEKEPEVEPDPIDTGEPTDLDALLGNDEPVDLVEEFTNYEIIPAEPKGGEKAFYDYLNKHIQYPDHLKGRNVAGRIFVSFEVDENDRISNVKILKGFDAKLEKEIIRVLENAPEWVPAQQGHRKVTTRHKIPFSFRID